MVFRRVSQNRSDLFLIVALIEPEHYLLQDNAVSVGTKDVKAGRHRLNDVLEEREGR